MKLHGMCVAGYGMVVMLGGLVGYLLAGSIPSLISGSITGAALVTAGLGINRNSLIAHYVATALSFMLCLFFSYRLALQAPWIPSGPMVLLSGAVFLLLVTSKRKKSV